MLKPHTQGMYWNKYNQDYNGENMENLSYPIGQFEIDKDITKEKRERWIEDIERAPTQLNNVVDGLTTEQIDTPYRPGGWTVRQVVHHLPESHLNAYTRFKIVVTEEEPTIRTYDQTRWAEILDAKTTPIEMSLNLLESLHERWVFFLKLLKADDALKFNHPEIGKLNLSVLLSLYAWHGRHHIAHISSLRARMEW